MPLASTDTKIRDLAHDLLVQLYNDRESLLLKIERYIKGEQDLPYIPRSSEYEYKLLALKSVTNVCAFTSEVSVQGMYVDSFRRGAESAKEAPEGSTAPVQPEWDHWQRSRLDARQHAVYRSALNYGHAFVATEKNAKGVVISRGLSPLRATAIYDDPANDEDPIASLEIIKFSERENEKWNKGLARLWTATDKYDVTFEGMTDRDRVNVKWTGKHGSKVCPVTRFTAAIDLDGNTVGVVEPLIVLQDRLNQAVFDLLVTSTYSSFKVRTVTGMAPPVETSPVKDPETGKVIGHEPKLGDDGKPIPKPVQVSQSRFMFAADKDTEFGSLEETPLAGFIESIKMTFQHIAALTQTPPHFLLGQIANLSSDALEAAEASLARKVEEFQAGFGESWERVFRLAAALSNDPIGENDYSGEVVWRDIGQKNMAQVADGLGKLADSVGIPRRGLWSMVPGVTAQQLSQWEEMRQDDDYDAQIADALNRGATGPRPSYREQSTEDAA